MGLGPGFSGAPAVPWAQMRSRCFGSTHKTKPNKQQRNLSVFHAFFPRRFWPEVSSSSLILPCPYG